MVAVKRTQTEYFVSSQTPQYEEAQDDTFISVNTNETESVREITHTLHEPLMIAANYLFAAKTILKSKNKNKQCQAEDYLELAYDALDKASLAVKKRPPKTTLPPPHKQSYDLQNAVYEAASMSLLHFDHSAIHTVIKCKPQLPGVSIERTQIHHLILNLLLYLAETSPLGSIKKFEIEIAVIQYGHISVRLSARLAPPRPEKTKSHLPGPYRLCNDDPALRLETCQNILRNNGGEFIEIPTNKPQTTFQFTLPILI